MNRPKQQQQQHKIGKAWPCCRCTISIKFCVSECVDLRSSNGCWPLETSEREGEQNEHHSKCICLFFAASQTIICLFFLSPMLIFFCHFFLLFSTNCKCIRITTTLLTDFNSLLCYCCSWLVTRFFSLAITSNWIWKNRAANMFFYAKAMDVFSVIN